MNCQRLGFLHSLLCKWQSQATLTGKSLLPVLLIVRWLMLGAAMQTVWEVSMDCPAYMANCEVGGSSEVTRLSPARLWTLQLLLVLAAGLVFLFYLIHLTNQETQMRTEGAGVQSHILVAYLACMASVIVVEAVFVGVQSSLHGFWVETLYRCRPFVDCILPRAWEKTVFLVIMFTASCLSLLLSLVEIVCVLLRAKPWRRQPDAEKAPQPGSEVKESRGFLRELLALWFSHAGLLGKCVLPVLQFSRFLIIRAVVQPVWLNEDFACDSSDDCTLAVFDSLFPFSFLHYCTLQAVVILASCLVFFGYLVHLIVTEKHSCPQTCVKGHALGAYLGLLTALILLEVGSAVGQAVIYGFSMSDIYNTGVPPCPFMVRCFNPRAQERTVFMLVLFSVTCLSVLVSLVEMCVVLKRERPWRKRQSGENSETSSFELKKRETP